MIFGHHFSTLHIKEDNNSYIKEKQELFAEVNIVQKALILFSQFGVLIVFFAADLTFLAVGLLMFQVILIYLRHMRESLNELRMRNRLELAAEMWPSQESIYVVDIKYLVCIHQYTIE